MDATFQRGGIIKNNGCGKKQKIGTFKREEGEKFNMIKAKIKPITSDTHQSHAIPLHHYHNI